MNSPTSHSPDNFAGSDDASAQPQSVAQSIALCAADATSRKDFLQLVAAELATAFDVGIVAVELGGGAPMMLVRDDLLGVQIDRDSIRQVFPKTTRAPIACDLPFVDATGNAHLTRALNVQIQASPQRVAFLLIYSSSKAPGTVEQIQQLKRLGSYADAIRDSLHKLTAEPTTDTGSELSKDVAADVQLTSALSNRQSLQVFHQDLNVDATAFRIANVTRQLLQCDRVSVLLPRAGRYRVRAISGVSIVDTRSNSVRCTEALTDAASVMSCPMIFPSDEPLPPQITSRLDEYLDETGVTATVLLPLHRHDPGTDTDQESAELIDPLEDTGEMVAVLMLEYFSGDARKSIDPAIRLVSSEAVLALQNALEHDTVFGLHVWKLIGTSLQALRRPLVSLSVLAIACVLIACAVVPIEHHVIATGTSQPFGQRQVFANVDGIVKKIHVTDGQTVKAGDPILDLENAELESQAEAITGEMLTSSQRLASIQAVRLSGDSDPHQTGRLVMEERQLQSEIKNLQAQQALIERQQAALKITSPIDGTIVAWQLDRRLSDRPVARGNLLVSVVDHSGPWSLQLTVPDQNAGPVLEAFAETNNLPVRFAVATLPDASFAATMDSLSTATRMDDSGQHVIDITATVRDSDASQLADGALMPFDRRDARVGADVTAKIACGQRTILRSWFGDVFDFVDRNILFYFR